MTSPTKKEKEKYKLTKKNELKTSHDVDVTEMLNDKLYNKLIQNVLCFFRVRGLKAV